VMANDEIIRNDIADDEIEFESDDQESLVLDLDTAVDNQVEFKSGATQGVTAISFSSLNMVTTGTMSGKIPTSVDSSSTPTTVTTAQAQAGTFIWNTLAGTKQFDLPAVEAGMAVCAKNGYGVAQILRVNPNGSEYIVMEDGTRTTAGGDYYEATADAGNQICLVSDGTDWFVTSVTGTWTEE